MLREETWNRAPPTVPSPRSTTALPRILPHLVTIDRNISSKLASPCLEKESYRVTPSLRACSPPIAIVAFVNASQVLSETRISGEACEWDIASLGLRLQDMAHDRGTLEVSSDATSMLNTRAQAGKMNTEACFNAELREQLYQKMQAKTLKGTDKKL